MFYYPISAFSLSLPGWEVHRFYRRSRGWTHTCSRAPSICSSLAELPARARGCGSKQSHIPVTIKSWLSCGCSEPYRFAGCLVSAPWPPCSDGRNACLLPLMSALPTCCCQKTLTDWVALLSPYFPSTCSFLVFTSTKRVIGARPGLFLLVLFMSVLLRVFGSGGGGSAAWAFSGEGPLGEGVPGLGPTPTSGGSKVLCFCETFPSLSPNNFIPGVIRSLTHPGVVGFLQSKQRLTTEVLLVCSLNMWRVASVLYLTALMLRSHLFGDGLAISCTQRHQFVSLMDSRNVNSCCWENIYELFIAAWCCQLLVILRTPQIKLTFPPF